MATDTGAGPAQRRSWSVPFLLTSVFCSSGAWLALTTVLGKQVYDLTGSKLALGLLGLAEFLPSALLVLVTGALADRVDRRRVSAIGALCQAAVALTNTVTSRATTERRCRSSSLRVTVPAIPGT